MATIMNQRMILGDLAEATFEYSFIKREVAPVPFESVTCSNSVIIEKSVYSLRHDR